MKSHDIGTGSQNRLLLYTPLVRTGIGKMSFSYNAPYTWNNLQKTFKIRFVTTTTAVQSSYLMLSFN